MKNKRGWIRIVEAFIAILIIMGALLIILNKGVFGKDISEQVYESQISVLREIERTDSMRTLIVGLSLGTDQVVEWEDMTGELKPIREKIESRTPAYLECVAKICNLNEVCALRDYDFKKDVYAQAIAIAATSDAYNPKQLKMFCWEK